tara:strand:+ start:39 stop:908 length:870 start_codon:yes stop_codon:yes gene_type:complete
MTKYLKTKEGSIEDIAKQLQNKVMENDYQDKFKKELDKAGKPLGQMTGAEKKSFFNKIDKMHKGKNENAMSVADVDRLKKQGMKKEDLNSKDKPTVKDVIGQLKGAVKAHDKQAKDLEKAVKSEENISERGGANTSSKQGSFAKSRKPKYRFGYRVAEKEPKGKEQVNETHTTQTAKANAQQRAAGGEKSPISLMKNKSIDEITKNDGKTFAQMRAEIDEACWDSHKQVGFKMKGGKRVPNCVPKNEEVKEEDKKEQEAGTDTRDKKKKTMTGQVATSPEMNPKVDYKY